MIKYTYAVFSLVALILRSGKFVFVIEEANGTRKFPKRDLIGYCENGKTLVSLMYMEKEVFVDFKSLDPNIHLPFYYGC